MIKERRKFIALIILVIICIGITICFDIPLALPHIWTLE